jgi:nucleoside 2-deoxyribosyltransferase
MTRVYLAGPEVFLQDAVGAGERKKVICAKFGFEGVFPLDQEVKLERGDEYCRRNRNSFSSISVHPLARKIRESNENLIRSCGLVIANLTPFRGISGDVGTAYEVGFARALGIPCFLYSNTIDEYLVRVVDDNGGVWYHWSDGRPNVNDMAIESFGLPDNLMLFAADAEKDFFVCSEVSEEHRWSNLYAFEACVAEASRRGYNTTVQYVPSYFPTMWLSGS